MKEFVYPASLLCDFYKISHRPMYPDNTEKIYSTWTPRTSRLAKIKKVVAFGFQGFTKKFLIGYFNKHFFSRPLQEVVDEYVRYIKYTLSDPNPDASHIIALHKLGYLPLRIRAVKEGMLVPVRVPMLTVENTLPEFFWVTNYIETLMSCELWLPTTSATLAFEARKILEHYCAITGGDPSAILFQGHDFSMRGMGCLDAAKTSGAGHLLSFTGTDTIPAIMYHEEFYNANIEKELVGASIPASEHSVMEAFGRDEISAYREIITKKFPSGFVSVVSDTWDFWSILRNVIPALKSEIMARDGRVVIRPDSGDPVKIICGDPDGESEDERKGALQILWEEFGGTKTVRGYKQLDPHIGLIYGDAITLERMDEISRLNMENGFASTNVVYGIGSFTYQYNTRDTFGFALKTTYGVFGGEEKLLFKDPVTDKGSIKKSQLGMVVVQYGEGNDLVYKDGLDEAGRAVLEHTDLLEDIFLDGKLMRDQSLSEIRSILTSQLG